MSRLKTSIIRAFPPERSNTKRYTSVACTRPPGRYPISVYRQLNAELPSNPWTHAQTEYLQRLPPDSRSYLKLYTSFGDRLLNSFLRGDPVDKIPELIRNLSQTYLGFFVQPQFVTLRDFVLEFFHQVQSIIEGAPLTDRRMVLYRGQKAYDNFARGTVDRLYASHGMLSTSIYARLAMKYVEGAHPHLVKVIIPSGYPALYLKPVSIYAGEEEVLLPHGSTFYVLSSSVPIERREPTPKKPDEVPEPVLKPNRRNYSENSILMVGQRALPLPSGWDIPLVDICRFMIEYDQQYNIVTPPLEHFLKLALAADNPRMVALARSMA
ncbi:MAG: ADP-ribosyltransferase [Sulfobacillus sp.]